MFKTVAAVAIGLSPGILCLDFITIHVFYIRRRRFSNSTDCRSQYRDHDYYCFQRWSLSLSLSLSHTHADETVIEVRIGNDVSSWHSSSFNWKVISCLRRVNSNCSCGVLYWAVGVDLKLQENYCLISVIEREHHSNLFLERSHESI